MRVKLISRKANNTHVIRYRFECADGHTFALLYRWQAGVICDQENNISPEDMIEACRLIIENRTTEEK